ncbi:hypothetical protein ACWF8U_31730 [Streptomyces olivaceus]
MRLTVSVSSFCLIGMMLAVWVWGDLDTAGKVASVVGACVGVAGIAYTALKREDRQTSAIAKGTGTAESRNNGFANTGLNLSAAATGNFSAETTGDTEADGGTSNSGIVIN